MTVVAICGIGALAACESASGHQYDGVSRFAGAPGPYYGPGSPPREPHIPEVPAPEGPASNSNG
jgi:hypothetical protein